MSVASPSFENGLKVVSSARKLIFKVPPGPVVEFPEGAPTSPSGQNNGAPVVVVHNHVDVKDDPRGTWQGADSTDCVVIMNAVPQAAAGHMLEVFGDDPTVHGLGEAIRQAEAMGCLDNYTTSVSFVDGKLSPAGPMLGRYTGIVKRDEQDVCLVVRDADGTIWRKLGDKVNHIDTDAILVRDYVLPDGSKIDPASIPTA
jgi:hypothetical protein